MRSVLIYCGCLVLIALNLIQQGLTHISYAQEVSPSTSPTPTASDTDPSLSESNSDSSLDPNRPLIPSVEPPPQEDVSMDDPQDEEESVPPHSSLTQLYTHLLDSQTSRLIPDVRNGLIRVGAVLIEAGSSI